MFPLFLFTCTLILTILTILTTCLFFPFSLFLYSFVQLLCRYRNIYLLILIILILTRFFFTSLLLYVEFEREIKNQIEQTMKSIKVHFEFFKSRSNSGKWNWTSLMGPNKKKCDFYDLYLVLRSPNLTYSEIDNFENKAKQWIKLFCQPSQGQMNSASQILGLYRKEDVTSYMHTFS
ncbi:hypothetical protein GLOIN_2v1810931 [Rhizophagus irregularis DAOM 181602=DAOM 197198]|nr:hypothetical protein GLOIN_2v1810931 [Rhizophagus irregularis DAOM 181602=DAOM 197198]